MKKNRDVLFVDDHAVAISYYVDAVDAAGWGTVHELSADGGSAYLRDHIRDLDAVVLDMDMPVEDEDREETHEGAHAGLSLIQRNSALLRNARLPVIVLSNLNPDPVARLIREQDLLPAGSYLVTTKVALPPNMLPHQIERLVAERDS